MKLAFTLFLLPLMILPAVLVVRLRMARLRRQMAEQKREQAP